MNMTFLDPGQFTARLDLEAATATPDGQGGAALSWMVAASLWPASSRRASTSPRRQGRCAGN